MALEMQLILACIRAGLHPGAIRPYPAAQVASLNWPRILALARQHRLQPLLHHALRTDAILSVPAEVRRHLEACYLANAARVSQLNHSLLQLLALFATHRIRVLPWRGPVIAHEAYHDPVLRQFDDLDFLVHPEDLPQAIAVLRREDYVPRCPLADAQLRAYLRTGWEYVAFNARGDLWVELAGSIVPHYFSFRLPMDLLWQSPATVTIESTPVFTLAPEHLLLLLCVHGTKHLWCRLVWIADLAAILPRYPQAAFDALLDLARRTGSLRMLLVGLDLAQKLLQAELPQGVRAAIARDPQTPLLAERVMRTFYGDDPAASLPWPAFRFHVRARERLRDRLAYCFRLALTPSYSDIKVIPLPDACYPLYAFIRPFRLAWHGLAPGK